MIGRILSSPSCTQTSPESNNYNCIAWAMEIDDSWWWPTNGYFWPKGSGVKKSLALSNFIHVFSLYGYTESDNSDLEPDFRKIALYVRQDNVTHAARQDEKGIWLSKIKDLQDISHLTLNDLVPYFGDIGAILKRPL